MRHKVKHVHFVGIGGAGMSGIAEVLLTLHYKVSGSDLAESTATRRLRQLGARIHIGHAEAHIAGADAVVMSSAVKDDNPEVVAARAKKIPVVPRALMLAELMRLKQGIAVAGTHGKTTTTSLIASVLAEGGLDPTFVIGGRLEAAGSNARLGKGDWMVAEADESDGTFLKLPATVAVVTNIDPEHLDHYGTFDKVRAAFEAFVANIPFYGFATLCIDHPEVQAMIPKLSDRRIVTYGFSPQADVRAVNLKFGTSSVTFDAVITDRKTGMQETLAGLTLPMLGEHNVQNSLVAVAIAREMGLDDDVVRRAFAGFGGVKRRFTRVGDVDGITIIDDYGHHPVEIAAVLKAARTAVQSQGADKGQVIAVVQPHRFTRLRDLFEEFCTCFNDADAVVVADVYPAGEEPIAGVNRDALVDGIEQRGHRAVVPLTSPAELPEIIAGLAGPGDLVVCLGAGDITGWANALPDSLRALRRRGREAANDER